MEQERKCRAIPDLKNSTEMCNKYAEKALQKDQHVILTLKIPWVYQDKKKLEEKGIPDRGSSTVLKPRPRSVQVSYWGASEQSEVAKGSTDSDKW